ncbi:MAG: dTDP-4-dehydrorhamnose reductase [archaeon]
MKVLVLGSGGQLGQDLVKVLQENNEDYYAATREDANVTKKEEINKLLERENPSAVVNCSAFHDCNVCEEEPENAMEVNAKSVMNIAKKCKEMNIKFMTISTDYVFNGENVEGYSEDDKVDPIMWYGKSKLAGEWLSAAYNDKTFVVRTQSLYGLAGPKGKGLHFVDLMLKLSKERDELKVDQCRMAPTWTYPLAKNMYELLKTEHYGTYHMSCQGITTWYEFAKKIMELTNNPVKITPVDNNFYPRKFKRPENSYLINKKLKEINLDLMPSWEDALKGYLQLKGLL